MKKIIGTIISIIATTTYAGSPPTDGRVSETVIDGSIYLSVPVDVYKKIPMQKNEDGTLTIFPNSRPPELNELHQRYCESIGGRDITDETQTTITTSVKDTATCLITSPQPSTHTFGEYGIPANNGMPSVGGVGIAPNKELNDTIFYQIPMRVTPLQLGTFSIDTIPANGVTPFGQNYHAMFGVNFLNTPSVNRVSSVSSIYESGRPCRAEMIGTAPKGYSEVRQLVVCLASQRFAKTEVRGCWGNICKIGTGQVTHY